VCVLQFQKFGGPLDNPFVTKRAWELVNEISRRVDVFQLSIALICSVMFTYVLLSSALPIVLSSTEKAFVDLLR
jgi:hypothetical protein